MIGDDFEELPYLNSKIGRRDRSGIVNSKTGKIYTNLAELYEDFYGPDFLKDVKKKKYKKWDSSIANWLKDPEPTPMPKPKKRKVKKKPQVKAEPKSRLQKTGDRVIEF